MTIERWGHFLLVSMDEPSFTVTLEQPPAHIHEHDPIVGPWDQPGSSPVSVLQDTDSSRFGRTPLPSFVPSGLDVGRLQVRHDDRGDVVEAVVAYALRSRQIDTFEDAELHVVWSALIPRPVVKVLYDPPFEVLGAHGVGGWMLAPEKLTIGGHPGVYASFEPAAGFNARTLYIGNAIQWFDGHLYRTVLGYYDRATLLEIAESLDSDTESAARRDAATDEASDAPANDAPTPGD